VRLAGLCALAIYAATGAVCCLPLPAGAAPAAAAVFEAQRSGPTADRYTIAAHRRPRRHQSTAAQRALVDERRATQWINPPSGAGE